MDTAVQTSPEVKEEALLTLRQQLGFEDFGGITKTEKVDAICSRFGVQETVGEYIYSLLWDDQGT